MKRRLANQMMDDLASTFRSLTEQKPVQPLVETSLNYSGGGRHAGDQQTSHGGESLASAWDKPARPIDMNLMKPGVPQDGYGVSPDPSSLMEELNLGRKANPLSTELQLQNIHKVEHHPKKPRVKDPAEDNFEFSDESQTQLQVHPRFNNTAILSEWDKPIPEPPKPESPTHEAESIKTEDQAATAQKETSLLTDKADRVLEIQSQVQPAQQVQQAVEKTQLSSEAAGDLPVAEQQSQTANKPKDESSTQGSLDKTPAPVGDPLKDVPVAVILKEPVAFWIESPSETHAATTNRSDDFFGASEDNSVINTQQSAPSDGFDNFQSDFATKAVDKKQADNNKQIVVETGANPNKQPSPDVFDFGQPISVGFKKKNTKSQVNAVVVDFFDNPAALPAQAEPQNWEFGPSKSKAIPEPIVQEVQKQPEVLGSAEQANTNPFAAFTFETLATAVSPIVNENPQQSSGRVLSNSPQPFQNNSEHADLGDWALGKTDITKIEPPLIDDGVIKHQDGSNIATPFGSDPFADFDFGTDNFTAGQIDENKKGDMNPQIDGDFALDIEDIRAGTTQLNQADHSNVKFGGVATIGCAQDLAPIAEESREESQLGIQIGGETPLSHGVLESGHVFADMLVGLPPKGQEHSSYQLELEIRKEPKQEQKIPEVGWSASEPFKISMLEDPISPQAPITTEPELEPKANNSILDSSELLAFPAFDQISDPPKEDMKLPLKKQDSDIFGDIQFPTFNSSIPAPHQNLGLVVTGAYLSQIEPPRTSDTGQLNPSPFTQTSNVPSSTVSPSMGFPIFLPHMDPAQQPLTIDFLQSSATAAAQNKVSADVQIHTVGEQNQTAAGDPILTGHVGNNTTALSSRIELNESAFEAASESLIGESDTMIIGVNKELEEPKVDMGQILPLVVEASKQSHGLQAEASKPVQNFPDSTYF
jgi:hypothetical protein